MKTSLLVFIVTAFGLGTGIASVAAQDDPIRALVDRLDLEKYKATIKGLTQFGDRRQGTDRNRAAVDWIEAQLKSYGCTNTERIKYTYDPPPPRAIGDRAGARRATPRIARGRRQGLRGIATPTGVNTDPMPSSRTRSFANSTRSRRRPDRAREVYCTKIGATHPEEMYIVSGHMDGHGWGEAANDDGSGTALVMELARVFSGPTSRPSARSGLLCGTTKRPG